MLVLARIELICLIIASMGLCFGFVLETVLIIQGCFHYCWAVLTQSQGLFCLSPHPTSEEAGGAQGVWSGHSWDSWPQLTKGISHTIWHHAQHIELGGGGGSRGHLEWWHLSSQVTIMHGVLLSGDGWTPACQQELVNEFLVSLCVCMQLCSTY